MKNCETVLQATLLEFQDAPSINSQYLKRNINPPPVDFKKVY